LAFATIANHDRVGLILCSDRLELVVPPKKGKRHTLRLVREILGFQPQGHGTNLGLALDHLRHVLHRKSVVFVVSDFLDQSFETKMAAVARKHDLIAMAVDDPMEIELPSVGLMDVVDAETGGIVTVDTSSARYRAAYRQAQIQRREGLKKMLRRYEVDLVSMKTNEDYAPELVRFFRRRMSRLGR